MEPIPLRTGAIVNMYSVFEHSMEKKEKKEKVKKPLSWRN